MKLIFLGFDSDGFGWNGIDSIAHKVMIKEP